MKAVTPNRAFALFLTAVAAAALVVGVHDAALARAGFAVTAGGAVLVVGSLVLLVAAFELVRPGRPGPSENGEAPAPKLIIVVAFLLTLVVGVYVFFAAIRATSAQRPVVVVVSVALIVGALLGLRQFVTSAHTTLPRLGAAVAVALVGTTIGAWEFWYQNHYVPSHAGSAVMLKVRLQRDGTQPGYDVVRATLGYEDVGGKSVSVVGSTYTLTGSRVVRCHVPSTTATVQRVFKYPILADPQRSRYMADVFEERPATVLAAGKFVADGKRLDTGVAAGRDLVFLVPRHSYQLLRFRAQLFAIPGSVQLSQRTLPTYKNFPGDNELYGFWHIDDNSWFHDLVYGRERWVVMRYEFVDPGNPTAKTITPDLRVTARFPDPTFFGGLPSQTTVNHLFSEENPPSDSSEPFADTEMALEPVAEPSSREASRLPKCTGGH